MQMFSVGRMERVAYGLLLRKTTSKPRLCRSRSPMIYSSGQGGVANIQETDTSPDNMDEEGRRMYPRGQVMYVCCFAYGLELAN